NGLPASLTEYRSPLGQHDRTHMLAIYAQDQWTIRRLTLNGGMRYDHIFEYAPGESLPAVSNGLAPAIETQQVANVPNWNDVSPRLGAAYDLFGNAKTAVKGAIGRYVLGETNAIAIANAQSARIATTATRVWTDTNGNFFPDCVLANPLANGECNQLSNLNF